MITATPAEQRALLDIQSHVSALNVLARQRTEAQQNPDLLAARTAQQSMRAQAEEAASAKERADASVEELEAQADKIQQRIAKNEAQLMSGQSGSATLQSLQRDIETLTQAQGELENQELSALDAAEEAEKNLETAKASLSEADDALGKAEAELEATLAGLDRDASREQAARAEIAQGVPSDLLEEYENRLARYGVGAARLTGSVSGGSGMELSPGDLAEIRRTPADQVVFCPDSGAILVRDAD